MKNHCLWIVALAAFASLSPISASGQDHLEEAADVVPGLSRPAMTALDLVTMPRLGPITATSDGQFTVYSVISTDPLSFERATQHYLLDLATPGAEEVEISLGLDAFGLTFGPDDFLYFISYEHHDAETETRARVWRVALEADGNVTGPFLVADMPSTDIHGFKISPTGDKIALWSEIHRDCPQLACASLIQELGTGRLYDGATGFYRHWDRWLENGQVNRTFVYDLNDGRITGEGLALDGGDETGALTANTPTRPFGGSDDIAWAPDGSAVYFVARKADAQEPRSTNLDIYRSDLSGAAPINVTEANPAHDSSPVVSPDGRFLAYLAMERPGYEADQRVVYLRDLRTEETRALTKETDLSFSSLSWTKDGDVLLATGAKVLDTPVFAIDPKSGDAIELDQIAGAEGRIGSITPLTGTEILFARDSIGTPRELFVGGRRGFGRPITEIATATIGKMASTVTRRFSFEGADGDTVWGQITRLEEQEGPIPAILYIHGGPQSSARDAWSYRWNPRVFASQGYAVISIDFHGSVGYGQDFTDSINADWGGKPLDDLQKGLSAALTLDTQIDGTRICAMGASYGGYMVNWIAGNWPDRFDCLIQHDGLFDLRSFYFSTDELWFPRWEFGGSYSDARETYERWNPVNHIDKWQTPMLVIASEQDFRVPYTQGLQSFTALQERGIPSQLLVFPDENHWVSGAENSLQWHETVFAWLERWLKDDRNAAEQDR